MDSMRISFSTRRPCLPVEQQPLLLPPLRPKFVDATPKALAPTMEDVAAMDLAPVAPPLPPKPPSATS
jgi:hypothetical protein